MRRLAAAALVLAALAAPAAHAARCGEPFDTIGQNAPEPVREAYLKVCGV